MTQETLSEILEQRRRAADSIMATFRDGDVARKGAAVLLAVKEVSGAMAQRSEVLRPELKSSGQEQVLAEYDRWREGLLETLSGLDALASEVGPRDVMVHDPRRITALMGELEDRLAGYHAFETGTLVPFLESLGPREGFDLGRKAEEAEAHAPTHPHPHRPPADERNGLVRSLHSLYDRARDETSHPAATLQGKGEEGP